jgi:CRISPR-associated protein Cas2
MARNRHLIAYDISDPGRLRRVIKLMEGYGTRLQYSVFLCDLNRSELIGWNDKILEVISLSADSVIAIDLGPVGSREIKVIGSRRDFPMTGPVIV